jgi:hypothetical protein
MSSSKASENLPPEEILNASIISSLVMPFLFPLIKCPLFFDERNFPQKAI